MLKYVLELREGVDYCKGHRRFPVGCILSFEIDPGNDEYDIDVYINIPNESFSLYDNYELIQAKKKPIEGFCYSIRQIMVKLVSPGPYFFYALSQNKSQITPRQAYTLKNDPSKEIKRAYGVLFCGYFVVDPIVTINKEAYSPNILRMQTHISKCLGPVNEWQSRLLCAYHAGYNAIHFTPMQEYGISNSSYSIKNHKLLDRRFGGEGVVDVLKPVMRNLKSLFPVLIVDIILNHVANNADIALTNPEISYNLVNSPHLKLAWLVDRALIHLQTRIISGKYKKQGIAAETLRKQKIVVDICEILKNEILPLLKLEEFFLINKTKCINLLAEKCKNLPESANLNDYSNTYVEKIQSITPEMLKTVYSPMYERNGTYLDLDAFTPEFVLSKNAVNEATTKLSNLIDTINARVQSSVVNILDEIHNNVKGALFYRFITGNEKRKFLSNSYPLVEPYFSYVKGSPKTNDLSEDLKLIDLFNQEDASAEETLKPLFIMANQGWVMGDSTIDFASPESQVYLRRRLVVWGDSIKLNYGKYPEDAPVLWKYMIDYVSGMAEIFDGFRLDNCHSTPIHVLEILLKHARAKNPNLILIAELFTNSEETDNKFVNRLGINALIRERMAAHTQQEFCRIAHRFGGDPIASFLPPKLNNIPKITRAIFTDMTHDNPCIYNVFTPYEYLPTLAFVSMNICPISSVRGYDEMLNFQVDVVTEERLYAQWSDVTKHNYISMDTGVFKARLFFNQLHKKMECEKYLQIYIDQLSEDVVSITRFNPDTCKSIITVVRSALSSNQLGCISTANPSNPSFRETHGNPSLLIPGDVTEVLGEFQMLHCDTEEVVCDETLLPTRKYYLYSATKLDIKSSRLVIANATRNPLKVETAVTLNRFSPGSCITLSVSLSDWQIKHLEKIKELIRVLVKFGKGKNPRVSIRSYKPSDPYLQTSLMLFATSIEHDDPNFYNILLFKTENEELENGHNMRPYEISGHGKLPYCGIMGLYHLLLKVIESNDLGHPLCKNIRDGPWLFDYIAKRLTHYKETVSISSWLTSVFEVLKKTPSYMQPCLFANFIVSLVDLLTKLIISNKSAFVKEGDDFIQSLVLSSYALYGKVNSAPFPQYVTQNSDPCMYQCTLSAGLPCFSTSWMRMWGRDTMISLRGLFCVTGRYKEAKELILSHSAVVWNGMVPNLMSDGGKNSRFNARDASWWFLQAIKDYCSFSNDYEILNASVLRFFHNKNSDYAAKMNKITNLSEIMQEILENHYKGISYVEKGAGPSLDSVMKEEGFHVKCGVKIDTGFVYGGNTSNCGTWMDKMGSSSKAGNIGVPATPRDGSAVELVGLNYSVVSWISELASKGSYPFSGVNNGILELKWNQWCDLIKGNFENKFWIPSNMDEAKVKFPEDSDIINLTGIYKDTVGSIIRYTDYQFRPNFLVAAVVAPELFNKDNLTVALRNAQKYLMGHYGMKTLAHNDMAYRGRYMNVEDTNDYHTSKGFNYHQGPEWLWLTGYFLRALIASAMHSRTTEFFHSMRRILRNLYYMAGENPWMGLPELTNANGEYCYDSARIQSWSIATILDALNDMNFKQEVASHRS